MSRSSALRVAGLLGLAVVFSAPAITPAFAQHWDHRGGWGGGHVRHDWGRGRGGVGLGGVLLGLGVGAAVGAALAAPPPVYYAPPPAYAAPPAYYAPPPVYYGY